MTGNPNIVLVSWDSVRADHLSSYGYERNTAPVLTSMAKDGLLFEDAYVPAVGTPASFTGMFTGQHASGSMEYPNPSHWKAANQDRTLLPEVLQDQGYYTGGFHFNALMSSDFGWDRGWDEYDDHMWTAGDKSGITSGWKSFVYSGLQRANVANFAVDLKRLIDGEPPSPWEALWDGVNAFIKDAPEPFFLWVLLIDTHHPYFAPPEYHEWQQPSLREMYIWNYIMRRSRRVTGERRAGIVNAYDNTIRYADKFLENLLFALERNGYGDAPTIVHSDHGDEFGEHSNYGHRPLMYDTLTKVPLVMQNVYETGRITGPTSLLDLGSTILDLAESDMRLNDRPSLLDNERSGREYITIQNIMEDNKKMAAVVSDEWKVLYHPRGNWGAKPFPEPSWEAYHKPSDPNEQDDRWGEHPEHLEAKLRDQLSKEIPRVSAGTENMSARTEERLRELGYIE